MVVAVGKENDPPGAEVPVFVCIYLFFENSVLFVFVVYFFILNF